MPNNKALKKLTKSTLMKELQATIGKLLEAHGNLTTAQMHISQMQEKILLLEDAHSDLNVELQGANALVEYYKEQLQMKRKERTFQSSVSLSMGTNGPTETWTKQELRRGDQHGSVERKTGTRR